MSDKIQKTDEEWRARLNPEQFRICREKGTEQAFTGEHYANKARGRYTCACCSAELFGSEQKYDSGSGWPSFWQPAAGAPVAREEDRSHGMVRVEVHCDRCGSHLGHVFEDGPQPTGLRYCINSASLSFEPDEG